MSELKTENLTVAYKSRKSAVTAIDGLTAVFPSDSFNVIVGYSGCGKTTLLKSVLGLLGYSGHIFFDGEQIDGKDVNKRNFSYVSQEYALYSHLTVFDNIAFPLKVMGADKTETRKRVGDVAAMLDIAHCLTRKPKHLSGGQQQRVAIARALIKRPRLCLFDEPLSNIDVGIIAVVRVVISVAENTGAVKWVTLTTYCLSAVFLLPTIVWCVLQTALPATIGLTLKPLAPFCTLFISTVTVKYFVLAVTVILVLPVVILGWMCYATSVFDKYFNEIEYPQVAYKGLYRKTDDRSADYF